MSDATEKAEPTLETLIEPVCVYCNKAPWSKHRARCEPCVQKAVRAAVQAATEACASVDPHDIQCPYCGKEIRLIPARIGKIKHPKRGLIATKPDGTKIWEVGAK